MLCSGMRGRQPPQPSVRLKRSMGGLAPAAASPPGVSSEASLCAAHLAPPLTAPPASPSQITAADGGVWLREGGGAQGGAADPTFFPLNKSAMDVVRMKFAY